MRKAFFGPEKGPKNLIAMHYTHPNFEENRKVRVRESRFFGAILSCWCEDDCIIPVQRRVILASQSFPSFHRRAILLFD